MQTFSDITHEQKPRKVFNLPKMVNVVLAYYLLQNGAPRSRVNSRSNSIKILITIGAVQYLVNRNASSKKLGIDIFLGIDF
jgi:hypothetical protein